MARERFRPSRRYCPPLQRSVRASGGQHAPSARSIESTAAPASCESGQATPSRRSLLSPAL